MSKMPAMNVTRHSSLAVQVVVGAEEAAQHADTPAAQTLVVEVVEVARRDLAEAGLGDGVLRVAAGDHVEHGGGCLLYTSRCV